MFRRNENKKQFGISVAIIVCLAVVGTAQAGWPQQDKLTVLDTNEGDWFGYSVSITGDYCIVGAYADDENGTNSGSAYIFKRSDDFNDPNWYPQKRLLASDGEEMDWFGCSVSISGYYAIVGAKASDDNGQSSGSAYIFYRDQGGPNNWGEVVKLTASDAAAGDHFGESVSICGETAIVGADGDDSDKGSAYIFERNQGGIDNWGQQAKLTASDGAAGDWFGISVSISGNYAIVGAPYDDNSIGSAYIFYRNQDGTDNWGQQAKLTASDGATNDCFGWSVSISGIYTIVGAFGDGNFVGAAYIFEMPEESWVNATETAKLTASDADVWNRFGWSVSISGDVAMVGADFGDGNSVDSGSAYVFQRDGTGWVEQAELTAADGAADDGFGRSVSITEDVYCAIVGAYLDDDYGDASGSAYMFKQVHLTADLSGDGSVNLTDFAFLGDQWFQAPGDPSADIAPKGGDGIVDYLDLDILTEQWLQGN
jgi:hypothetical protein